MITHFVEVSELKTDNCFLDWRMTDNCLACKHFVALVKSMEEIIECIQPTVDIVNVIKPIYNFKAK